MSTRDPCLLIESDKGFLETFQAHCHENPDWDALRQSSAFRKIQVYGDKKLDLSDNMLHLSLALKSNHGISAIKFDECVIDELGHLCMATIEPRRGHLLNLEFKRCTLEHRACKTLGFMLKQGAIGELSFLDCSMDDDSCKEIEIGLEQNTSLTKLEFSGGTSIKMDHVYRMVKRSENIAHLGLTKPEDLWQLFYAAFTLGRLESLQLSNSKVDHLLMQPIVMMCFAIKSFRHLTFHSCAFTGKAMIFLAKTLTENMLLDTLRLEQVTTTKDSCLRWNCLGSLQVKKLCLKGTEFFPETLQEIMDDISDNPRIESLDLSGGVMERKGAFETLCNDLLLQNLCPPELIIDSVGEDTDLITETLQRNSSLKSLTIGGLSDSGLVTFAHGVANMNCLRNLCIQLNKDNEVIDEFLEALGDSLLQNTTLTSLTLCGIHLDHETSSHFRYLLATNRVGRYSLMTEHVSMGIWAKVLERSSYEPDGIFFVLMEKPGIIAATRKRKHRGGR
jgi:hypothetical protein